MRLAVFSSFCFFIFGLFMTARSSYHATENLKLKEENKTLFLECVQSKDRVSVTSPDEKQKM
jgi:hypothetical protein